MINTGSNIPEGSFAVRLGVAEEGFFCLAALSDGLQGRDSNASIRRYDYRLVDGPYNHAHPNALELQVQDECCPYV